MDTIKEYIQKEITLDFEENVVKEILNYENPKYRYIIELYNYDWDKISTNLNNILVIKGCWINDITKFMDIYKEHLNWTIICEEKYLTEDFMEKVSEYLDWKEVSFNQQLSEKFIRKHKDKLYWEGITAMQKLSEDFIEEFSDWVDWEWLAASKETFSQEFRERNAELLD